MVRRYSFIKDIQRQMALRSSTRYLTKEEKQIKALFRRTEYADEWLKLRRKVMLECEEVLQECIPLLKDSYSDLIINIARNIVRLTWPFSASETHHHPHIGGLPLHLCETMLMSIKLFKVSNTSKSLAVESSKKGSSVGFMNSDNIYKKAVFSLCLASLAHDIGKVYDQQLSSKQPGIKYYPLTSTPEVWLADKNLSIEHVNLGWLAGRDRSCHAMAGLGVLQNLLSPLMVREEYSDIVGSFGGDHVLAPDPNSNEIPLNNLSKMGTFLHLTNVAILYHNNMEYEDKDNFVLEILRQADADSAIEWSEKVVTSFTDYFKNYLKQEIGQSIAVNDNAFLTVYARKSSRYVLIPIKRLHEGFTLYINSFGMDFTIDVKGMRMELVRHGYSSPIRTGSLESLLVEITCPQIVKGIVETIMIDTSKIDIRFEPKRPDLAIHLQRSNMQGNDTLGRFYFTPPITERTNKKKDFTGKKEGASKLISPLKNVAKGGDFDAFIQNDTVIIDGDGDNNSTNIINEKPVKVTDLGAINIGNVELNSDEVVTNCVEGFPNIIREVEKWVLSGKIKVNDFSTPTFLIVPENMPGYMFIKVRDPIVIDKGFVDDYVKDLVKMSDKFWGDRYLIQESSFSVKGPKGGAVGDYLIMCPISPNVSKKVGSKKGIKVVTSSVCTSLDEILKYCELA